VTALLSPGTSWRDFCSLAVRFWSGVSAKEKPPRPEPEAVLRRRCLETSEPSLGKDARGLIDAVVGVSRNRPCNHEFRRQKRKFRSCLLSWCWESSDGGRQEPCACLILKDFPSELDHPGLGGSCRRRRSTWSEETDLRKSSSSLGDCCPEVTSASPLC
jgi:hypothetical protein